MSAKRNGGHMESFLEEKPEEFNPFFRQLLASIGPILIIISNGIVCGYSAILLPQLDSPTSPIQINKNEQSWIASMAPLPMALGCSLVGWEMDRFGRKISLILNSVVLILGWIIIYFSTSVVYLLIGRAITGFCIGGTSPVASCYMAEVTSPKYRGLFLSCFGSGIAFGLFLPHLFGTFWSWNTTSLLVTICPIVCIILMPFIPESHVWYLNKNDIVNAKKAFHWFRGSQSEEELEAILDTQSKCIKRSFRDSYKDYLKPTFYKPLMILNLLFMTVQFSGNNAVIFYSVSIMQETVKSLDKYAAMLIVDVIRVIISLIASGFIQKYKVRPLIMISGFGSALSLFTLSICIHAANIYPENIVIVSLPLFALLMYIVFVSFGLTSLPWALCGELFPAETKGIGGAVGACVNFLSFFVVVKTSLDMFEHLGSIWTFATYGSFSLIGTTIAFFVLPETKGRTLNDIEKYFNSNT